MMTKPGLHVSIDWWRQDIPKHMQKSAWWCSVTYMAVQIWLQFHFKSFVRSYVCSMNDFEVNKTMSQILDVKLRLDHTLSQSTDKLRSDNSLFQIVLIERGFVIQSIILLYIKETDGRPADGAIQSRIGWEEMEEDQGTPYALRAERNWRKKKYADAGRQNLALNAWNEQRPWLSYISPHVFTPKEDQEVGQMDDFHIQSSNCAIKVYCYRIWRVHLSDVQPFSRF